MNGLLLLPVLVGGPGASIWRYAFVPGRPTLTTLVSATFLHVGLWHYLGNMWFLWIFGRRVECALGHLRFAVAYLLCGVGGQLFHLLFNLHSLQPCVGASGAISGVAGLYFALFPQDRFHLHLYLGWFRVRTIASTTRGAVGAWVGEQVLLGLLTRIGPFASVAFWAHVGGFATGVAAGFLYLRYVPRAALPGMPLLDSTEDGAQGMGQQQPTDLTPLKLG